MTIERRTLWNDNSGPQARLQKRMDGDDDQLPRIAGTAALIYDEANQDGTRYQLWSDTFERIMPGAFDRAVGEDDVRGLFNHNASGILGRNIAGTMNLSADATGLHYDIDTADTQCGRDTVTSIQRGDLTGSSFQFRALTVTWREETNAETDQTIYFRDIDEVELFDVGPVTFPAYSGTSASAGTRGKRSAAWACDRTEYRSGSNAEADAIMAELTSWMGQRDAVRFKRQRQRQLAMARLRA